MMRIQAAETLLRAGVIVDDPPALGWRNRQTQTLLYGRRLTACRWDSPEPWPSIPRTRNRRL